MSFEPPINPRIKEPVLLDMVRLFVRMQLQLDPVKDQHPKFQIMHDLAEMACKNILSINKIMHSQYDKMDHGRYISTELEVMREAIAKEVKA